ncbi:hypothetical protein C8R44DRAFT_774959 [Mycena epipterygia]|nr:hypothetical protein C8R44DRAFT_774959 [Mycena epipterygia]
MDQSQLEKNMSSSSKCLSPPAYSPPESSPVYSLNPNSTERTLQQSRRRSQTPPNGLCVKRVGNVTMVLLDQEENVEQPEVRSGTQLNGSVLLQNTENIKSVVLAIDGLLETLPLPAAYSAIPVVGITNTLYSCNTNENSAPSCPHSFAFSHRFPSTFHHKGNRYPLPPTCRISLGGPVDFIRCAYRITVTVVSARHRYTAFLTRKDHVSFDLKYRPRTRPSQPIILNPSLFDTVKRCPEEWAQCPKLIPGSSNSPLMCDLFAPSVGVFCANDPIPFHLQLSSSEPSCHHMHHFFRQSAGVSLVRVYILRQISADAGNRIAKRKIVLGEGALRLLPPASELVANDTVLCMHWEGEARCRDPASVVGSFDCGSAAVVEACCRMLFWVRHQVDDGQITI